MLSTLLIWPKFITPGKEVLVGRDVEIPALPFNSTVDVNTVRLSWPMLLERQLSSYPGRTGGRADGNENELVK